ncbi:hypothetical protein Q428_03470 [Fervidicella metallireducens AeB]|uniref:Lipoprotein n=1 Tax=Fervidicella metallireducens AeB TaxID=1403537 RepID=A0A017RWT4_9CLOT|nr:hypothetical protein [Fervidicella metallireducens]EYE89238.1 hypothetical protein Q428_03470 [Fervidicella metallireducens AeB]
MKKTLTTISIFILGILFVTGCSNSVRTENQRLNQELISIKSDKSKLEKRNSELEKNLSELTKEINELKNSTISINDEALNKSDNIYKIYTANNDTYEKEIGLWVYIPKNISIINKLDMLGKTLSDVYFNGLEIKIEKIENTDGRKIAVINLKESKINQGINDYSRHKGSSWAKDYFQGSAGGTVTATTLIETFLQRDYRGDWIDGIRFLYNGKELNFDHVESLNEISFRK